MTREGWRDSVIQAVRRHDAGDSELLELATNVLVEHEAAKQALREKGYGCTGMGLLRTVGLVPEAEALRS